MDSVFCGFASGGAEFAEFAIGVCKVFANSFS